MNVYKCDRCGQFFEPIKINDSTGRFVVEWFDCTDRNAIINNKNADLCPECKNSFKEWMDSPKGGK